MSAEETIEVEQWNAVVAFEMSVMQVVKSGATGWTIVSIVTGDRTDVSLELGEEKMKRMATEEKRKVNTRVIEKMFDRMHRETCPGARISAAMMETVEVPIEKGTYIALSKSIVNGPPRMHQTMGLQSSTRGNGRMSI